jgi:hypothetical protein
MDVSLARYVRFRNVENLILTLMNLIQVFLIFSPLNLHLGGASWRLL